MTGKTHATLHSPLSNHRSWLNLIWSNRRENKTNTCVDYLEILFLFLIQCLSNIIPARAALFAVSHESGGGWQGYSRLLELFWLNFVTSLRVTRRNISTDNGREVR